MKGMIVPLAGGLHLRHDWNGDLTFWSGLGPNDAKGKGWQVEMSLDPYPTDWKGKPTPYSGHGVTGIIAALRANKNLKISVARSLKIGGVAGKSIDVQVQPTAPKGDPGCPAACIAWLGFRRPKGGPGHFYNFQIGNGANEGMRLYLAGLSGHVLTVFLDTSSRDSFGIAAPVADALVAGLQLPSTVTPG
jgi:hypothetical protein